MLKSKIQNPKSKIQNNSKFQIPKQLFCYALFVICTLSFGMLLAGCVAVTEVSKGIAGTSTKVLEENRYSALAMTVYQDYFQCYNNALRIVKEIGGYVYAQDLEKDFIAFYVSEQDTTPVGVFFKQVDESHTRVEVSSPSAFAKELIAKELFSKLANEKGPGPF